MATTLFTRHHDYRLCRMGGATSLSPNVGVVVRPAAYKVPRYYRHGTRAVGGWPDIDPHSVPGGKGKEVGILTHIHYNLLLQVCQQ